MNDDDKRFAAIMAAVCFGGVAAVWIVAELVRRFA
jgi:hypothetical protein